MVSAARVAIVPFLAAHKGSPAGQHFCDNLCPHRAEQVRLHDIGPGPVALKQGFHETGLETGITRAGLRHASRFWFRTGQTAGSHDTRPRSDMAIHGTGGRKFSKHCVQDGFMPSANP